MVVSLNYCSQNGGNLYRAPSYNGNPNIGPRIIGNLDQYPEIPFRGFRGRSVWRSRRNYMLLVTSSKHRCRAHIRNTRGTTLGLQEAPQNVPPTSKEWNQWILIGVAPVMRSRFAVPPQWYGPHLGMSRIHITQETCTLRNPSKSSFIFNPQ